MRKRLKAANGGRVRYLWIEEGTVTLMALLRDMISLKGVLRALTAVFRYSKQLILRNGSSLQEGLELLRCSQSCGLMNTCSRCCDSEWNAGQRRKVRYTDYADWIDFTDWEDDKCVLCVYSGQL